MEPQNPFFYIIYDYIKEKITNKIWPNYVITEDVIYAYKIEPLDSTYELDFKTNLEYKNFTYFILITKVGITKHGKNTIKNIHINFTIEPKNEQMPQIQIKKIVPNDKTKEIGTIEENNIISTELKINSHVGANIEEKELLNAHLKTDANISKRSNKEKIVKINHPKSTIITTSSGIGNEAIWEFKQGDYEGWNGEYNFNIYFRILESSVSLKTLDLSYLVIPTIIINGQQFTIRKKNKKNDKNPLKIPLILIGI
jgi:hypothetical protein